MNPYQDVIDWLRSPEGSKWSEQRMVHAGYESAALDGSINWRLNTPSGVTLWEVPLYLGGVLSVKEDYYDTAAEEAATT